MSKTRQRHLSHYKQGKKDCKYFTSLFSNTYDQMLVWNILKRKKKKITKTKPKKFQGSYQIGFWTEMGKP